MLVKGATDQCQAIIWTSGGLLLIGTVRTIFSEILIEYQTFSLKKRGLNENVIYKMAAHLYCYIFSQTYLCFVAMWHQ